MSSLLPLLADICWRRKIYPANVVGHSDVAPARKQDPWGPALGVGLQDAELELRAVLAQAKISLGELVRLTPGDIIPIEPPQDVVLLAGDVALHRGRFGVSQGHNALKIIPGGPA